MHGDPKENISYPARFVSQQITCNLAHSMIGALTSNDHSSLPLPQRTFLSIPLSPFCGVSPGYLEPR